MGSGAASTGQKRSRGVLLSALWLVSAQVLANALIPLLAALALVPVTGGADVPLAAGSSLRVVRLLGAFLGEGAVLRNTMMSSMPCNGSVHLT